MMTPPPEPKFNIDHVRKKYGIIKRRTKIGIDHWELDMHAVKKVYEVISVENPKVRAEIAKCIGCEPSRIAMSVAEVNTESRLLYAPYDKDVWKILLLTAQSPHIQSQIYRGSAGEFTTNPHQPSEALLLLSQNPNLAPELIELIVKREKHSLTNYGFQRKFEEPSVLETESNDPNISSETPPVFGGKLHLEALDQLYSRIREICKTENPNPNLINSLLLISSSENRKYDVLDYYVRSSRRVPAEFLSDEQINEFALLSENVLYFFRYFCVLNIAVETFNTLAIKYPVDGTNLIHQDKPQNTYLWIYITNHPNCPPALITQFEEWYTSLSAQQKNQFWESFSSRAFTKIPLILEEQIQFLAQSPKAYSVNCVKSYNWETQKLDPRLICTAINRILKYDPQDPYSDENCKNMCIQAIAESPSLYVNSSLQVIHLENDNEVYYSFSSVDNMSKFIKEQLQYISLKSKMLSDLYTPKIAKTIRSWMVESELHKEARKYIFLSIDFENVILNRDLIDALDAYVKWLYDNAESPHDSKLVINLVLDSGINLQALYEIAPEIHQKWFNCIYKNCVEQAQDLQNLLENFGIETTAILNWEKLRKFLSIPHLPKVLVNKIMHLAIESSRYEESVYDKVVPTLLNNQEIDLSQGFVQKILQTYQSSEGQIVKVHISNRCFFIRFRGKDDQKLPVVGQSKYVPFPIYTEYPKIYPEIMYPELPFYLYLRAHNLRTCEANQDYFYRFGAASEPVSKYFGIERFFPEIAKYMEAVSPQNAIQNRRRGLDRNNDVNKNSPKDRNKTKGGVLAFMDAFATEDTPAGFLSINSAPSVVNIISKLQQYVLEMPKDFRNIINVTKLYQQDIAQIVSGVEIYFLDSSSNSSDSANSLDSNSNLNSNLPNSSDSSNLPKSKELIFEVRINAKLEKSWNKFLKEMKTGGKDKKSRKTGKDAKNEDVNTGWELFTKVSDDSDFLNPLHAQGLYQEVDGNGNFIDKKEKDKKDKNKPTIYRLTIPAGDSTDSLIATETLKALRNALEPILKTLTNEKLDPAVSILETIKESDQQKYLDALNALDNYQAQYKEKLLQGMQEQGSEITFSQADLDEFGENYTPKFVNGGNSKNRENHNTNLPLDQVEQELIERFDQRLNQANSTNLKIDLEKFTDIYIKLEKELRTELSTKIPLKRWRQITPHLKESFDQMLTLKEDIENPNISETDKTKKIKRQIQQAINQNTKLDILYKRVFSKYEKEGDKQTQSQTNNTQTKTEILILEAYQRSVTIQSAINEILSFYKPEFILSPEVLKGGVLQTTELPQEFSVDLNQGKEEEQRKGKEKGLGSRLSALARLKEAPKDRDQNSEKNQTKAQNQQEVITRTLDTPGILLFLEKAREGYLALLQSSYTPENLYKEVLTKYSQNLVLSSLLEGVGG